MKGEEEENDDFARQEYSVKEMRKILRKRVTLGRSAAAAAAAATTGAEENTGQSTASL